MQLADQRLWFGYIDSTFSFFKSENFRLTAFFCDCPGGFVSDLAINPKTRFLALRLNYRSFKMSRLMGKPTICKGENKDADQLISVVVFATRIVQFLFYLNPKFQASSSFSVLVQVGLCRTCSETTLLVFPRGSSNV